MTEMEFFIDLLKYDRYVDYFLRKKGFFIFCVAFVANGFCLF